VRSQLYDEIRSWSVPLWVSRRFRAAGNLGGRCGSGYPVPEGGDITIRGGERAPATQVNAAEQEIDALVARAQRLLDQAQAQSGTAAAVFVDRMSALARQDQGGVRADLSGFMPRGGEGAGTGRIRLRRRLPGDPDYVAPPPPPALPSGSIQAIPGRRVTGSGAPRAPWMFVDSWYVVGPFPNPARKNLNTPFPPELLVDLDATYLGKNGRTVRWQFWQANSPKMVPPNWEEYAVYYYYTELYFDRPRDAWIAIGSDDKSTLWLNGQMVWMSADQLKGWNLGEGLRRVHFKAGRNPVLLRLENGWRGVVASVVISLKD
jgi:hypothetical protein